MNNPLDKFYEFMFGMQAKTGDKPAFIPISKVEQLEVAKDAMFCSYPLPPESNQVLGIDTFDTPFAQPMRTRQIDMPLMRVSECADALYHNAEVSKEMVRGMFYRLNAKIVSDTSALDVTFEFDPWVKVKRFLRITKWFPVKQRTVTLDCRVLYPYIKVALPHNKHHVQFYVRP